VISCQGGARLKHRGGSGSQLEVAAKSEKYNTKGECSAGQMEA